MKNSAAGGEVKIPVFFELLRKTKKLLKIKIKGAFRHKNPSNEAILYRKPALNVIFPHFRAF